METQELAPRNARRRSPSVRSIGNPPRIPSGRSRGPRIPAPATSPALPSWGSTRSGCRPASAAARAAAPPESPAPTMMTSAEAPIAVGPVPPALLGRVGKGGQEVEVGAHGRRTGLEGGPLIGCQGHLHDPLDPGSPEHHGDADAEVSETELAVEVGRDREEPVLVEGHG